MRIYNICVVDLVIKTVVNYITKPIQSANTSMVTLFKIPTPSRPKEFDVLLFSVHGHLLLSHLQ